MLTLLLKTDGLHFSWSGVTRQCTASYVTSLVMLYRHVRHQDFFQERGEGKQESLLTNLGSSL
jgi:hypothetical protein